MKWMTTLGLLLSLAGCICLYLSNGHQRWLSAAWRAVPACTAGAALLVAGAWCMTQNMLALTAVFVYVTMVMLWLSLLPYVGVWIATKRARP